MHDNSFDTLTHDDLDAIHGGNGWSKAGKVAKFAGKKVLGPVSAAWTAYDGVSGYLDARKQGKGVGASLWEGAKNAVW